MRPVLKNSTAQQTFDEFGYVHIPGFLSAEEVETLKKAYFDLLPERGGSLLADEKDFKSDAAITYDFTFIDRNWKYKQKVFDVIDGIFQQHYAEHLDNYKPIIANFIRKEEAGGEVPLHQNWAFVDEEKFTSVSIWVPLVDSNEANGTLQMVDRSHKRFGQQRGPMVPWELDGIGKDLIESHLTPMNVKAGDCVVLDDSIVHYSNINTTDGLRLTIQLILIPTETESIHHHLDREKDANSIQVLEVDRDFYMKFHPWKKPQGIDRGTQKFKARQITMEEFHKRMKQPRFDQQPAGFLGKIKQLFS